MRVWILTQCKVCGYIGDKFGQSEDHVLGVALLPQLTIHLHRSKFLHLFKVGVDFTLHHNDTLCGSGKASSGMSGLTGRLVSNI